MIFSPSEKPGWNQTSVSIKLISLLSGKRLMIIENSSTPSDHTVASFPWYSPFSKYSGGQYIAVPDGKSLPHITLDFKSHLIVVNVNIMMCHIPE